jgi:predicted ATP-dependent protease
MNRSEFFALLDSLTTSEIESRISSWDDEQLKLVEEYLQRVRQQNRGPRPHLEETAVTELAAKMATRANTLAMIALIIAIGAMLASIASGFVAFVALQH